MKKDKKYYLGIALFGYSVIPYIFTFLILPFLPISKLTAVSLATGLLISSEVSFFLSVALLGKPFIGLIKNKIKGSIFRKKGDAPLKPVGKFRHRMGITMLAVSSIVPYFVTEIALASGFVEKYGHTPLINLMVMGDVLFIISFFVLGGEFWERVNRLFQWSGETATEENPD